MKLDELTLTKIWLELCQMAFGYKAIPEKSASLLWDAALLVARAKGYDVDEYLEGQTK